jgi:[ribosomal protein S18]-alanine N-acetyltransferase
MTAPADDIDRIMTVMAVAFDSQFGEAWTRRQVEDALMSGLCHYRVLCTDLGDLDSHSPPAGFYLSRHIAGEEELLLIAVAPANRQAGIGTALLKSFLQDAKQRGASRVFLEMREANPAERLYLRFGFLPIGRRTNYYRNGSSSRLDAITFACDPCVGNAII